MEHRAVPRLRHVEQSYHPDVVISDIVRPGNRPSWLCYFRALQLGEASKVAPVDKLSVVVAMVLAVFFLGEHLTWRHGIGAGLIVTGTVIIAKI